jgi:small-conductance mechanosensitive channel
MKGKFMEEIFNFSSKRQEYLYLILISLAIFIILRIIEKLFKKFAELIKDEKKSYHFYSIVRIVVNVIYGIIMLYMWGNYIDNIVTIISFLSAGFAIAIRDVILNWICGIYIRINKPFKLEDRIEVGSVKGDVISINTLCFELLEVSEKEENGQSTGVVINFPNSYVFTEPIKNMTKGFKYIWNEMQIKVVLGGDIVKSKQTIYKIVNNIDIVRNIPKKMKKQINAVHTTYRIYYNNYDPIIYTKIENGYIVLTLRYLIHPKKARYVESTIWNKIYEAYKNGEIDLYTGED